MTAGAGSVGAAVARPELAVPPPIPPADPVYPDDHAIVVGIDHYPTGIPALQGAINDCRLFTRWLVDPGGGGLDPAKIKFYASQDPTDQLPRLDQIQDLLIGHYEKRIATGQRVGRRLYMFMSGHGVSPPVPDNDDCALVTANGMPTYLRALIGGRAATAVRRAGLFEEVMLVMDCCREVSGEVMAEGRLPPFEDPTLGKRPFLHVLAAGWGATAAERLLPDPLDPTRPPSHHGVLTHALLVALRTAADDNGEVTAATLKSAIRRGVRELLGDSDPRLPEIRYEEDIDPMSFGRAQGIELTLRPRPGTARVEIRHGSGFTPVALPAASTDGAFRLRLTPGIYLIEGFDAAGVRTASFTQMLVQEAVDVGA